MPLILTTWLALCKLVDAVKILLLMTLIKISSEERQCGCEDFHAALELLRILINKKKIFVHLSETFPAIST